MAKIPNWDLRTSESPEEHDRIMAERFGTLGPPPWLSEGTEHCVREGGGIARRRKDRDGWSVEFASLDDLMAFVARHGDVVIQRPFRSLPRIEIYDDYRE